MSSSNRFVKNIILVIFFLATAPLAHAVDLSAFGAMSYSNASFTPSLSSSAGTGYGYGATIGFGLVPFFSIETGVMYLPHSYSAPVTGGTMNFTANAYEIPLLLRFSPIGLISINAGGYYGLTSSTPLAFTPTGSSTAIGMTGTNVNDGGLLFGVSVRVPLLPILKIRGDIMYEYGLINLASSFSPSTISTQYSRNLDFLLGLMISI
jgi:hypothetical protein